MMKALKCQKLINQFIKETVDFAGNWNSLQSSPSSKMSSRQRTNTGRDQELGSHSEYFVLHSVVDKVRLLNHD